MARSTITGDTGNGSTVTFASGITATLKVRRINFSAESVGKIDTSHLGTSGTRTFIPEDLTDATTLDLEVIWDTFDPKPVTGTTLGNVTVTFPLRTGETEEATVVAKGYVSMVQLPGLANNELQVMQLQIQYIEAIAYTPAT